MITHLYNIGCLLTWDSTNKCILQQDNIDILVIDDVITDGQTKIEAIQNLKKEYSIKIQAVFVAFDRLEINDRGISSSQAFSNKTGIPVHAIMNIKDLLNLLKTNSFKETNPFPESSVEDIESYLKKYSK